VANWGLESDQVTGTKSVDLQPDGSAPVVGEPHPGLVLVADGVGTRGLNNSVRSLNYLVARAGLPLTVQPMHWGHGFGRWHADLTNVTNHRARAADLVAEVATYSTRYPNSSITLIGRSGGSGIVALALEQLPPDTIELAIFLAPALSPTYDLGPALRAIRRELVVFWSPLDLVMLGWGTRLFGTIDRVRGPSAGLVGFCPPVSPSADYQTHAARLRQVCWNPSMVGTGYLGDHWTIGLPPFLARYVVPLLAECCRTSEPSV
jgi:hypothetical protein